MGLRGNVCNSSLARWKADSRLSIGYSLIEHYSLALRTEALIGRNPLLLKGVGHFGANY